MWGCNTIKICQLSIQWSIQKKNSTYLTWAWKKMLKSNMSMRHPKSEACQGETLCNAASSPGKQRLSWLVENPQNQNHAAGAAAPFSPFFIPPIKSAMQIASPQKSEQTAGRAHPDLFTPVPPGDNSFQTTSLTWFLIHRIPKVVIPKCMSRTPPVHGLIHSLGCKLNPHKSRGQRLRYLKKWMAED